MANTEIDSLSLNISINGLSDRDIKNLESLSNSIAKLQRNLKKLELSKLQEIEIPQKLKGIDGVELTPTIDTANVGGMDDAFKDVEETFTQLGNEANTVLPAINTDVAEIKVNTKGANDELKKTPKTLGKTSKQLSSMEKSLRRIKVISFVKLIRGALNSFIKGIGQGIKNLALFDEQFNQTMSTLTTAKTQIYNSLALIISPFITALTPLIETLSNGMVRIANTISQISASLNGMTKYTKINVDYMEDYAKSLQKASGFSFDTFETLNTQDSMFETAELDESEVSKYQEIVETIQGLKEALSVVKDAVSQIGGLFNNILKENISNILEIINQSNNFTKTIFSALEQLELDNLFNVLSEEILPTIIQHIGSILQTIGNIVNSLMPLINVILNKLLPAILKILNSAIKPLNSLLENVIFPLVTEIITEIVEVLTPILEIVTDIVEYIGVLLEPINDILSVIIKGVGDFLLPVVKTLYSFIKPIIPMLEMISNVLEIIIDLVESLFSMNFDGFFERFLDKAVNLVKSFAKLLENVINGFIDFINVIIANDFIKWLVGNFGGEGWKGIEWKADFSSKIPSFADGGIVGEVWQMNEKGNPEMLYNANNNSNTSVINIDQLAGAFERAIINTGLLNAIEESGYVYLDGKVIAQSKSFKNELNRTNPKLSLK